jgi:hypothetical protein
MHCRNCGAEIQKGLAKCGNCDEPVFIYTPSDAVKQRMENRKKPQPQPMKWKTEISLGVAFMIAVLSVVQCVTKMFSVGALFLVFLIAGIFGMVSGAWPVLAIFYVVIQFLMSFLLCYFFLSNVSNLGGFTKNNIFKAPMAYLFLFYLIFMFLLPLFLLGGPLM